MRNPAFWGQQVPLFFICAIVSWLAYYAGSFDFDWARRGMALANETLRFDVIGGLIAMSLILQVPVYLGHHAVRNKSLDLRAKANASKAHRDSLTKQANSLNKDAGRLILTAHRLQIVLCVSLALLVLPSLWSTVFPETALTGVQWRYSLIVGLGLFGVANFTIALAQFSKLISMRAKTVK